MIKKYRMLAGLTNRMSFGFRLSYLLESVLWTSEKIFISGAIFDAIKTQESDLVVV
jgi:hypothetical protein